MFWSTFPWLW